VEAALNAGMLCVGIGSKQILKKANIVISGLDKMNLKRLMKIEKISDHE
jgi:beta-phosphoglucomutase